MPHPETASRTSTAVELAGIQYGCAGIHRAALDFYANYYKDAHAIEDVLELLESISKKLTHPAVARELREACERIDHMAYEGNPDTDHCVWPWRHANDDECVYNPGA